ncbi:unnamed protein product [Cuscuta campestris]|uniref:Uncharacterized protein n=1 Tax=Cuscuta campestris TaxID=132261 RepID=A0A484KV00_9ASTE|nr:unnamed protein product [Cuscuta campestris]
MDNYLLLGHFVAGRKSKRDATKQSRSRRSSSHGEDSPPREQVVIEVEDQDDAALETGTMAINSPAHSLMLGGDLAGWSQGAFSERPPSSPVVPYEVATEGRSTRFNIPPPSPSLGDVQLETLVTLDAQDRARISAGSEDDLNNTVLLKLSQATLGMIELVGRRQDRQATMDEARKAAEDKQRELHEEVAHLARELEEEKGRSAVIETKNASLSSELGSVSARVAELEGEKTDLIQQLEVEKSDQVRRMEEAIESFKSSPDFAAVAMEQMDKLVAEWLKIEPGVQWMNKEGKKSFNCGLFRAQQVFRNKLARFPKGFSFPDLDFPPPCRALAEFDPSPYLDEGSSSASNEEEEEAALDDQGGSGDQNPGANPAASKAGGSASLGI